MTPRVDSLPRTFITLAVALAAALSLPLALIATQSPPPLTVHEWGTFTTIAGDDGQAIQWLPLGGPTDLPCFVETYRNREFKIIIAPQNGPLLNYDQARAGLKGSVRMETPVLYFYADAPTTANVNVVFPQGLFTEFYPHAEVVQSPSYANILSATPGFPAKIAWKTVNVRPNTSPVFPTDRAESHYYAARATDAAPIRVDGQDEKFLFYRGVAGFPVPIATRLEPNGRIRVKNLSRHTLPAVMVLTKRGSKFGYRVHGALAGESEVVLDRPLAGGMLSGLRSELERTLVAEGLYEKEAKAMVDTWRDDWFDDGTRVFYVVPAADVDAILPLTISPAPVSVVRVFVGRMEVITPETEADVARALSTNDARLIEAYGRWLGPIGDRVVAKATTPDAQSAMRARQDSIFKAYLTRVTACH